jgi:hypothetical protein
MSGNAAVRRGALVVLLLVLAVVSAGCVSVIDGTPAPARVGASPTIAPAPVGTSSAPTPVGPTPAPAAGAGAPLVLAPVVPGWNAVRSVRRAAAYDVPPTWNVRSESTVIGYRDKAGNMVVTSGAATFGDDACAEHSHLALAGLRHDEGTDLAVAARYTAELWAGAAYLDDAGTVPALTTSAPQTITTVTGQQAAVVEVTAALSTPLPVCGTTTGTVYAVAAGGFTGELGPTVVLVVVADAGVPGAVAETDIRTMLASLRPAS